MLNFVENILITIFSILPDADTNNSVITSVNGAFTTVSGLLYKINLIFPIYSLFKILLIVLFIEMTIFLISIVFNVAKLFKP